MGEFMLFSERRLERDALRALHGALQGQQASHRRPSPLDDDKQAPRRAPDE